MKKITLIVIFVITVFSIIECCAQLNDKKTQGGLLNKNEEIPVEILPRVIDVGVNGISCSSPEDNFIIKLYREKKYLFRVYGCRVRSGEGARFILEIHKREIDEAKISSDTLKNRFVKDYRIAFYAISNFNWNKENTVDIKTILDAIEKSVEYDKIDPEWFKDK